MLEIFLMAFVTFFVIIDPPGIAPFFAGVTEGGSKTWRRTMAIKASTISVFVLLGFAFGGASLLSAMGVSISAFRVAGGILMFLIAVDMLFEKRTERREARADAVIADMDENPKDQEDISVFPLAIPLISGPGAIAAIMLYMAEYTAPLDRATILAAAGINILMCLGMMLAIDGVMKVIGKTFAAMITRIFGVILAALAAQMVVDGLKVLFG